MNKLREMLREKKEDIIVLCGAGVSYDSPTNIPTVNSFIQSLLDELLVTTSFSLEDMENFNKDNHKPRFELLIDELARTLDTKLAVSKIFSTPSHNKNHLFLAKMLKDGSTIVTTNFDTCIENASKVKTRKLVFKGADISNRDSLNIKNYNLIKPHGCISDFTLTGFIITISSLNALNHGFINYPKWRNALTTLFSSKTLIVLGYSGSDNFDITPILEQAQPKRVYWLTYDEALTSLRMVDSGLVQVDERIKKLENICFIAGSIEHLISMSGVDISTGTDLKHSHKNRISIYFESTYKSAVDRYGLLFTILHFHGREDMVVEIIEREKIRKTKIIALQYIRALHAVGRFDSVIINSKKYLRRNYDGYTAFQLSFLLSSALYKRGEVEYAREVAEDMLNIAQETSGVTELIQSQIHISSLLVNEGKYKDAIAGYNEVKILLDKSPDIVNEATYLWGFATALEGDGDYLLALDNYRDALQIFSSLGATSAISYLHYNIGNIFFIQKQVSNSLIEYRKALSFATRGKERATFEEMYAISGILKHTIYFEHYNPDLAVDVAGLGKKLLNCQGFPLWFELLVYGIFMGRVTNLNVREFQKEIYHIAPLSENEGRYKQLLLKMKKQDAALTRKEIVVNIESVI